ncbi:MAG: phiJL1 [Lachnospiraceae bacterium]|nr:phiJL1 [Lachnospiraceae bacterium]
MKVGDKPLYIPIEVKKKCIELSKSGKTSREVYMEYYSKTYDTQYESFRRMLKQWKHKKWADETLLESGNLGYNYTPHATTVQVNGKGEVVQAWIKSEASDNVYMQIINTIKSLSPFEPVRPKIKEFLDRMLEITFDDMHWGIAFFNNYEDTLNDTLELIKTRSYKVINIVIGEDLLHTEDLKGHTSNGTYIGEIDVKRAYDDCLRFYFSIMQTALEHVETVNVIYSMGNHSETLSWTIVQVLKHMFPRANYDDRFEYRKLITYGKVFIGITHGDVIPSNLSKVKELFVEENPIEYANAKIKEIHIGHFHAEKESGDINGCLVRRLSTKVPTDKWHKKNGYTMAAKRFMLFEYTTDKLAAIYYV